MISCPSAAACGTSSYVSKCCSFLTFFSRASCRIDLGTLPKSLDHIVSGCGSCKFSATAFNSVYVSKLPSDSSIIANVSGFTEAGSQEFLHVSPAVLTRLPASTDASACSRFASSWAPPRSTLQCLTSWSRYASSESFQRLATPCKLPYRSPPRRAGVEAARPQVHVALLPLRADPEGLAKLGGSVALAGFLKASPSAARSSSERALVNKKSRFLASPAFE